MWRQQPPPASTAPVATAAPTPAPAGGGSLRKVRVKSQAAADPVAMAQLQQRVSKALNGSCASVAPAEARPLTALQKRQLAMKDKVVFSLGDNAVYRIKVLIDRYNHQAAKANQPLAIGVRVGVQRRGCSGYSYTVNYALETDLVAVRNTKADLEKKFASSVVPIDALDSHIEQSGVHVFVDAGALFYVIGTRMDYKVTPLEEKFEFANPNKKSSCGCEGSFQVDM